MLRLLYWLAVGFAFGFAAAVAGPIVLVAAALGWVAGTVAHYLSERARKRELEELREFLRIFPGSCPICSYTRFARSAGVTLGPVDHHCPEQKKEGA